MTSQKIIFFKYLFNFHQKVKILKHKNQDLQSFDAYFQEKIIFP
jgi:hypothetical protein